MTSNTLLGIYFLPSDFFVYSRWMTESLKEKLSCKISLLRKPLYTMVNI